jgi:hypothetical protein
MKKKDLNPEYFYKKLMAANWEGKLPYYSNKYQELKIHMRQNNSVEPGVFKPDPLIPGGWIAHEQTIRAVRKDIFMGDEDFGELEILYECSSCKKTIDVQFWVLCPYCGKTIPDKFEKISCN